MEGTATISLNDYERFKSDSEELDKLKRQIYRMCEVDTTGYKAHMKEWEENPDKIGDTDEEIDQSYDKANEEAVGKIVLKIKKEPLKQLLKASLPSMESEGTYILGEMETKEFKQVKIEFCNEEK